MSAMLQPSEATIDGARRWRSLVGLAAIGSTPKGGVPALALTDIRRRARDQVVAPLRAGGIDRNEIGSAHAERREAGAQAPLGGLLDAAGVAS